MQNVYVQYGCGLSAPVSWINFDASPSLILGKIPVLKNLVKKHVPPFPPNVNYRNIVKGLPVRNESCNAVHANYVLEHLTLKDFRVALLNSYKILATVGIDANLSESQDKRKRWIKGNLHTNIPLFFRPFFYSIYLCIVKLGFLDASPGLIWHFLRGFYYRFLMDAKIYDIEQRSKKENRPIEEVIKERYHFEI